MSDPELIPATKAAPCPVCDGDHKCSADGLIVCGRRDGGLPLAPPVAAPPPARDWVDPNPALLAHLKLPPTYPVGIAFEEHPDGGWLFPERNGDGDVIGHLRRLPDGQKRMVPGSQRGVYVAGGLFDGTGSVYVVEGASDTIALYGLGLAVVGRPSAAGGGGHLAKLLAGLKPERPVTVVGENDRAADGKWPGWDGAEAVARALADALPNPVAYTFPLPAYKDVRDWIAVLVADDRDGTGHKAAWAKAVVARYLDGGRRPVAAAKKREKVYVSADGWPLAVPAGKLIELADRPTRWVWDGFLARGCVTLLSALPKCGKTTLLASLLAGLGRGGTFAGRPLGVGAAVVISEEDGALWGDRAKALGIGENVRFCCRPFAGRLTPDQWEAFCRHAADAYPDADLIVFDTLANLWPVRDENSATEVGNALLPLAALARGRAVLHVHHLRKSDGTEGTAARGSGALAASVDILLELRRMKGSPAGDRRRALTGNGRPPGVPTEWVVERLDDGTYGGRDGADDGGRAERTGRREKKAEEREKELRAALAALLAGKTEAMTRKELWDALPDDLRVNEVKFKEALLDGVDVLWQREGGKGNQAGRYLPMPG